MKREEIQLMKEVVSNGIPVYTFRTDDDTLFVHYEYEGIIYSIATKNGTASIKILSNLED